MQTTWWKPISVRVLIVLLISMMVWSDMPAAALSKSAKQVIQVRVEETLSEFRETVGGAGDVLRQAKGVLVFPRVYQGGLVLGGKYGRGALQIRGQTVDYYSLVAGSYGFQLGGQRQAIILAFMSDEALQRFRQSAGWNVGADASVAVITLGAAGSIDLKSMNKPVLGFVVDQKGLMYNLSLEGTKINRLK